MPILTNLLLPTVMMGVGTGQFGQTETRQSHYGALNTYVENTTVLFSEEELNKIRAVPYTRTITIPILNGYDHTVLTVRSCAISDTTITATLKNIVRFHIAFDVDVIPAEYQDNYVTYQRALAHKIVNAKKAVYKLLDQMCGAHLATNKDTTQVVGNQGLYTGAVGEYQVANTLDFYTNLLAIMEQMDYTGPYFAVANTIAIADINKLRFPGGGAALDTAAIMAATQIQQFEYSNRVAAGAGQRAVYYVAPIGSVAIINFIDYDYLQSPDLNELDPDQERELDGVALWNQIGDTVYPQWKWGVRQLYDCSGEQKTYKAKCSADFALVADFVSRAGESPIKRFSVMAA